MDFKFIEDGKLKYDTIPIPDDLELNLRRTMKSIHDSRKPLKRIKIIGGFTAALFVFILAVNISPNLAYALNDIPLLKKLVHLVGYDKGFDNLVSGDRIQQLNIPTEANGAKFTINTIIGDDSKLWIGYSLQGNNLLMGQIKFRTKEGNVELPWKAISSPDRDNQLDVSIDRLVKDFIMDVEIYKDDPLFHTPMVELDEETKKSLKVKLEQSKLTTLNIPISLDNNVFKEDLIEINGTNKEFKSEIGTFKINKLKLSESRSIIYFDLLSDDYELIKFENPRLIDRNGKMYYPYSYNYENLATNNSVTVELEGGINDTNSLTFKCGAIKYISKKDKYITIDIKNKLVEPNNLGFKLVRINGNKITISTSKGNVDFNLSAKTENGESTPVSKMTNFNDGTQELEFSDLNINKIILKVNEVYNCKIDGFELKLVD